MMHYQLADELDMTMLEARFSEADLRGLDDLSEEELADIELVQDRIIAEQANPRDPTSDELDDLTFAEWMGAAPRHVLEYFDHWCSSLMCVSSAETSLYGMLLLWGTQRTAAFDTEPVSFSNRGDVIIKGGTQRLTKALAEASGAMISLNTRAVAVLHHAEGYEIVVQGKSAMKVSTRVRSSVPYPPPARRWSFSICHGENARPCCRCDMDVSSSPQSPSLRCRNPADLTPTRGADRGRFTTQTTSC